MTPTSVKKPAIPAWQEPCSSPYFFLYSGGGRGERESKPQPGQCVPAVCGAAELATSPGAAAGWALGHPPARGRAGKSPESCPTAKIQPLVPSGSAAANAPEGVLTSGGWGERSSNRGDGVGGG